MKLSTKFVAHAKPGRHADGYGLYLLVSRTRAKSWVLRVQVDGRRRDIGLGSVAQLSLAEARDKARELRKVAKSGRDPIAARDRGKIRIPTFQYAAEACHRARAQGWEKRHADAFLTSLRLHAFGRLGRLLVDSIEEKEILAVLLPIWQEKPVAARNLRQRISIVLDFAKGHGWRRSGAPREGLRALLAKQPRPGNFAAMPYSDVPAFFALIQERPASASRLALLFTILTAARSGEVRSARWSHVDCGNRNWTRPANLMKSREAHVVTLSTPALAVLDQARDLPRLKDTDLIFPGVRGQPLSDMALLKLVKEQSGAFTVHGFRAAFRTWAAEKMPLVPESVAEAALAHTVPDAVVRAYQRAKFMDFRRELLEAWGEYVTQAASHRERNPRILPTLHPEMSSQAPLWPIARCERPSRDLD